MPESLEALHFAVFPRPQDPTAHHPIQSPQTWRHSPRGQAEEEVALLDG